MKKVSEYLYRNKHLGAQLIFTVCISFFAFFTHHAVFLYTKGMFGDWLAFYSYFYDFLHSLNYFHEFPWWNPAYHQGFPQSYTAILGHDFINPITVVFAIISWLLGMTKIYIPSFVELFIVYWGLIIPFLYLLGLLLFSRQMFKSNYVIAFILIAGAFSQGLVTNVHDIGLEETAFSLLFGAAFIQFYRYPTKYNFLPLALTTLTLTLTFNYMSLLFNVVFIPMLIISVFLFIPRNQKSSVPIYYWGLLLALMLLCFLPQLITYLQYDDYVRQPMNKKVYEYFRLRGGNPLRFLTISIPGISYMGPGPKAYAEKPFTNLSVYNYMGVLALPLVFVGLTLGRKMWRYVLFLLLILSALIITLSSYSPIFSLIQILNTPFRAANHFHDIFYLLGAFTFLILAAALGFEYILKYLSINKKLPFWYFILPFLLSTLFSILVLKDLYKEPLQHLAVGFPFVVMFFYIILYTWFLKERKTDKRKILTVVFLGIMLIELSSAVFILERKNVWMTIYKTGQMHFSDPQVNSIGLPATDERSWYSRILLSSLKKIYAQLKGIEADNFPLVGLYSPEIKTGLSQGDVFDIPKTIAGFDKYSAQAPIKFYFGDFNGDKRSDILFIDDSDNINVMLQDKKVFSNASGWQKYGNPGVLKVGDSNGDGLDDIFILDTEGNLKVALSNGKTFSKFEKKLSLHTFFHKFVACADMNGDSKSDVFYYDTNTGFLYVSLSDGQSYTSPVKCANIGNDNLEKQELYFNTHQIRIADVNGDSKADLVLIDKTGNIMVSLSDGETFLNPVKWFKFPLFLKEDSVFIADVNGDSKADLVYIDKNRNVMVSLSNGIKFLEPAKYLKIDPLSPEFRFIDFSDINGDNKMDMLITKYFDTTGLTVTKRTYNTIEINVNAEKESLVYFNDLFSKSWRASINGNKAGILKVFSAYKGVIVPNKGAYKITFNYSPKYTPYALLIAYSLFFAVFILWICCILFVKEEHK